MDAAQLQDAEAAEDELRREPTRPARLHLVPPDEEIAYPILDVMVDSSVGGHAGAVGEVVRPAPENPVQVCNHRAGPDGFCRLGIRRER